MTIRDLLGNLDALYFDQWGDIWNGRAIVGELELDETSLTTVLDSPVSAFGFELSPADYIGESDTAHQTFTNIL